MDMSAPEARSGGIEALLGALRGNLASDPAVARAVCAALATQRVIVAELARKSSDAAAAAASALVTAIAAPGAKDGTVFTAAAILASLAQECPGAVINAGGYGVLSELLAREAAVYAGDGVGVHDAGRSSSSLASVTELCRALSPLVETGSVPAAGLAMPLATALLSPAVVGDSRAAVQVCWLLGNAAASQLDGAELASALFAVGADVAPALVRLLSAEHWQSRSDVVLQGCLAVCALAAHPSCAAELVAAGAAATICFALVSHSRSLDAALAEAGCGTLAALFPAWEARASDPADYDIAFHALLAVLASPASSADSQVAWQVATAFPSYLTAASGRGFPVGVSAPSTLFLLAGLLRCHTGHRATLEAIVDVITRLLDPSVSLPPMEADGGEEALPGYGGESLVCAVAGALDETLSQHQGASCDALRARISDALEALSRRPA
jgi:hypothetical protein